jgi:hypothetical protein
VSGRTERIGNNERLFREVNDRINGIQEDFGHAHAFDIVCECGAQGCMERLTLTHEQYTALRENPRTFAVVAGHVAEDVEDVVERNEAFWVVEKKAGLPAAIAESDQ